jgi:hypothetical protein
VAAPRDRAARDGAPSSAAAPAHSSAPPALSRRPRTRGDPASASVTEPDAHHRPGWRAASRFFESGRAEGGGEARPRERIGKASTARLDGIALDEARAA